MLDRSIFERSLFSSAEEYSWIDRHTHIMITVINKLGDFKNDGVFLCWTIW